MSIKDLDKIFSIMANELKTDLYVEVDKVLLPWAKAYDISITYFDRDQEIRSFSINKKIKFLILLKTENLLNVKKFGIDKNELIDEATINIVDLKKYLKNLGRPNID